MASDAAKIVSDLLGFHDFTGETVISVGAGGGQLAAYGRRARKVLAVDPDHAALEALKTRVASMGLADRFEFVESDFLGVDPRGDTVLFEFSLHEIPDPAAAIAHATTLAPKVLVLDHHPPSEWAYYCLDQEKIAVSWAAIERHGVRRQADFHTAQRFETYEEYVEKIKVLGDEAIRRSEPFRERTHISFAMPYSLALLR
jgi:ubiquinone/menaquinone biosynthesis C-methylase UbiE